MAFCAAFAAICSAVEQSHAGFQVSIEDSFGAIRERRWPFLRLSVLLLVFFFMLQVVIMALVFQGITGLIEPHLGHVSSFTNSVMAYSLFGLVLLIFSRFSLAMPALVLDDCSVGQSILRSVRLTQGKWPILAILLLKSILGGYVAGMIPFWLARWIPADVNLPSWFQWVLAGASITALTVVEPIMFIGFALLYLKTTPASTIARAKSATA